MSAYEQLVDRCCALRSKHIEKSTEQVIQIIIAEVLRTLATVTPEMEAAVTSGNPEDAEDLWLALLRASPLSPP